ncbi:hypothetical protein GBN33_00050 [Plesiomonas shigelloides]|nr:hypothetical protein GBN33_00050 [Plesiomonas shigelloides]
MGKKKCLAASRILGCILQPSCTYCHLSHWYDLCFHTVVQNIHYSTKYLTNAQRECQRVAFPVPLSLGG